MADTVYKKIEIVGTSTESFAKAAATAVKKAGETVREMRWFEVVDLRGRIDGGAVVEYQATVRIGFHVD
jgi:flavin-binding protein dodecin